MKLAIITGVTGQDGSYLSELLLSKNYIVVGVCRRTSSPNFSRIAHLLNNKNFKIEYSDLSDLSSLIRLITLYQPDEFYNLAAQSFVKASFDQPIYTAEVTGIGVLNCLEAIRLVDPDVKFYQASSSEMYGKVHEVPQKITTPFYPRSPYGVAKTFGHYITVNYRESYGIFACCGILFNHESQRRGEEFVTRKISLAVANIKKQNQKELFLGNLEAKRDWGHARDYVEAMWLMLQQDKPRDYVVATGETHTVREFCEIAFKRVGLDYKDYVKINPKFYRPAEVDILLGDSSETKKLLNWEPKISFEELVHMMVDSDLGINDVYI
jgi:GDPmannose 4,6-dehydratase